MDFHRTADGIVGQIALLFERHGHAPYEGARREAVSALEHALQCAQLAEWANAEPPLVAAALLHDVGHFLAAEAVLKSEQVDDRHELLAVPFLGDHFGVDVTEPIRLHVQAKRYLVAAEPGYAASLSQGSLHTLALQGGPMCREEIALFEALPNAGQALALRRWDDAAKQPGRHTPTLSYYLFLAETVRRGSEGEARTCIAAPDLA